MSWPFDLFRSRADLDEDAFLRMVDTLRGFLGAVAHASPSSTQVTELQNDLARWTAALELRRVADDDAPYGQLAATPSHALGSLPDISIEEESASGLRATVTFTRWHVGGGGTVHGGQVALVLDELMGRAQLLSGWIARTAYLTTTYTAATPYERPLQVDVRTKLIDGRKRFVTARLTDGQVTCATAEALFVRVARYAGPDVTANRATASR
ncbi:hypothetical protein [Nocardioides stalactiti]|uniref:hypothetical protein n=1 Tax=Nocardioides stalactiti TaxID=2755356 RepID=UPI00160313CE|nr:hypothetical protein [Nocardioides stalactiti]